jgi:hypothetical protein
LVAARADLILSGQAGAHAARFEAQVRRGTIRRLLQATYVHAVRAAGIR